MQSMIRQAQKMQEEMEKTQAELDEKEYETQAGGGAVKVKINGKIPNCGLAAVDAHLVPKRKSTRPISLMAGRPAITK